MLTLRELTQMPESSREAVTILRDLALEDDANPETGRARKLFFECFVHWMFAFPVRLSERLAWVQRLLGSERPAEHRLGARVVVATTAVPQTLSGYSQDPRKLGANRHPICGAKFTTI